MKAVKISRRSRCGMKWTNGWLRGDERRPVPLDVSILLGLKGLLDGTRLASYLQRDVG